ncbi:protein-disulfide reductase DsbD N-terminal domain-containing protein [Olivibacter sitiensis]|uniref:protein-disulfide reductase DsbD N-terminal domain-containing protein n=1 Tax=Olivibacter sitiensis TaxID=376470 RepID=UPI0004834D4E|nr:protein-disulfide reductase DsbD N-terminal domain-containing protein [Olivibacter sitiensis]
MKKAFHIVIALILFSATMASAQIEEPVKWSYVAKKINNKEAVVFLKATVDKGWHIYSQNVKEGGPQPTTFTFAKSADYTLVGKTIEPKGITKYEEVFDMDVTYFENEVVFQQKVSIPKGAATVKGTLEFMVCNDSKCLPPDEINFSVAIK